MGASPGLVVFLVIVRHSFSAFPTRTTDAAEAMTTLSLRELLATYQRLYERQFHEPLPDSQKLLLSSLPKFEKPSIVGRISPASSVDEPRSFRQDDDSQKEPAAVKNNSTKEPKVGSPSTTATSAVKIIDRMDSSVSVVVTSTSDPQVDVSTNLSPATTETQLTPETSHSAESKQDQAAPNKLQSLQKSLDANDKTPEKEQPGKVAPSNELGMNIAKKVEMTPLETVKIVPSVEGELPKNKSTSTPLKPDVQLPKKTPKQAVPSQPEPNVPPSGEVPKQAISPPPTSGALLTRDASQHGAPPSAVPHTPLTGMGPLILSVTEGPTQAPRLLSVPAVSVETVQLPRLQSPDAAAALPAPRPPPPPESFSQGAQVQAEGPNLASKNPIRAGMLATNTMQPTARTDPDSTRRLVSTQPAMRPAARLQSRPQQVMNHVVVPRTPTSGLPQQNRRGNGQFRTRQPQRRQPMAARTPLPIRPAPEGSLPPPPPPPPSRNGQKPINLIVIQDGRVIDLSPQQQRDLSLVISAMTSSTAETMIRRRRAPVRRAAPFPNFRGVRRSVFR
uniref:Flocculation protein FLO11-like n=1 Tax=Haemonchus contortus TaxID=6289 RepID=A0A7I4Y860_HAECO